jgi:hypothetical protein
MFSNNKAKWTFMVYLAGDNNLSEAGERDLGEMRSVGSTVDVNIVAEFDRRGSTHETVRYLIQKNGLNEPQWSIGETDCGDPKILQDFIAWTVEKYPAERYALILWNHGGGWAPSEMDKIAKSVDAIDYKPGESTERSSSTLGRTLFQTTIKDIFRLPTVRKRSICSDDGSGHSLDTLELGKVIKNAKQIMGQPLDILGMDACLMSNLEVAYQVKDDVKFIVASEENEPNNGWAYDRVAAKLVEYPEIDTQNLASHIVSSYVQYYKDTGYTGPVTQSALDLAQIDFLCEALDILGNNLTGRMSQAKHEINDAQFKSPASFNKGTLWDIANVCEELGTTSADKTTREIAQKVRTTLQPQDNTFVVAEKHNGTKVKKCGGVTIYLPPRVLYDVSPFYKDLEYAKDYRWLGMLEAFHST